MRYLICAVVATATLGLLSAEPPGAKPTIETKSEVPYRLTDTKHVLVRVKLNGKGPFNMILDTGAPAVFITKAVAKKVGLTTDQKGWGGFEKFEFEGGVKVNDARCRVEDLFQLEGMNGLGLAGVELHGVVGYNVLAKYRITYDFTLDKLAMVPLDFDPPDPKAVGKGSGQGGLEMTGTIMKMLAGFMGVKPSFETKPAGFLGIETEERSEGLFAKTVLADSPAAAGGIKTGDRIVSIKSTAVTATNDLRKAVSKVAIGDKLEVSIERAGDKKTLTVELGKGL